MRGKQKERHWKKWCINLCALFLSLLLFFAAFEITLRLINKPKGTYFEEPLFLKKSESPILVYELRPNTTQVNEEKNVTMQTNRDGFRDADYPEQKPPNTIRLLTLGDSVTIARLFNLGETYPKQLEKRLDKMYPCRKHEVFNMGIGGYSAEQEVEFLRLRGLKYQPDMVVVGYVLNDPETSPGPVNYFQNYQQGKACKIYTFNLNVPCRLYGLLNDLEFSKFVFQRVRRIRDSFREDYYHRIHRTHFATVERSFNQLEALARTHNFSVVVAIIPLLHKTEAYQWKDLHEKVAAEVQRHGFTVLDLYPAFAKYPLSLTRMSEFDIVHPSRLGHKLMAKEIGDVIREKSLLLPCS